MKKKLYVGLMILLSIMLVVSACGPTDTAEPTEPPAAEEEADQPDEAEEAAEEDDYTCEFDEQTCDFLEGKDFGGETLVVGVWGGVIEEIYREHIIPEIERRNGKVELLLGGTGDRIAKIYAEKGNPTIDVAYVNMYEAPQGIEDGVFEEASNDVPAYADLYEPAKRGGYGMSFMGLGIAYNPEAFDSPPDWPDLFKEEYAGKIATATFPGADAEGLYAAACYLNDADETDPDACFEKLQELKPIPMVYKSLDELFLVLEEGEEVVAAPVISGYAWTYIDKGQNIAFSWPETPGPIQMMDTMVIVKGTKHREMALAWAQMSLSPKVQKAFAEQIYFGPTNSNVELTGQVAERCVYGPDQVESLYAYDEYVIENRDELTQRWNREILE